MERMQPIAPLTERQREVLRLVERGHTNGEIAEALGISLQGAKWHVRELLTKFNAETREELIELRASDRAPMARVGRWLAAIGSFGIPKASAAAVFGGGAVVASVAIAGAVLAARSGPGDTASEPDGVREATATPSAVAFVPVAFTAAPMPTVTGAIWTPQEALAAAVDQASAEMIADDYGNDLDPRPNLRDFTVTRFEWHPAATKFDLPGDDLFWENREGSTHNLWWIRWEASGLTTTANIGFRTANVVVDLLLEDGLTIDGIRAIRLGVIDPSTGIDRLGSSDGFGSRERDAQVRAFTEPIGPTIHLAWENGVVGARSLGGFPTEAGTWCYAIDGASRMCSFRPEAPSAPVNFVAMSSTDPSGRMTSYELILQASTNVATIQVLPGDGRVLEYTLSDPPPEMPVGSRFALIEIGSAIGSPVVIGYDASGNEVSRRDGPGLVPPPGAGVPPPPPRTIPGATQAIPAP